jgi:predicted dehydrogenase
LAAGNPDEGRKLRDAAIVANVAHVVTLNYRGNPLVQQVRGMVASGETGPLSFIHGYYLQDWMTDPIGGLLLIGGDRDCQILIEIRF